jgi:hypothetical protein
MRAFEREQVLGAVVAGQRGFLDRFILDAGSLYSSRLFSSSGGFTKR